MIRDAQEMKRVYGALHAKGARLRLNLERVPSNLREMVHYAAFWGHSDDVKREHLIKIAPPAILADLKSTVQAHDDALDEWVAGPDADAEAPTDEYIAFSAMRMAADFI